MHRGIGCLEPAHTLNFDGNPIIVVRMFEFKQSACAPCIKGMLNGNLQINRSAPSTRALEDNVGSSSQAAPQGPDYIVYDSGEIELQTNAAERLWYELASTLRGVREGDLACALPVPCWPASR